MNTTEIAEYFVPVEGIQFPTETVFQPDTISTTNDNFNASIDAKFKFQDAGAIQVETTNTKPLNLLKKRKEKIQHIDYNDPQATIFEIVKNPQLGRRKARKTTADEAVNTDATTQIDVAPRVTIQNGKLVANAEPTKVAKKEAPTRITSNSFKTINRADKWTDQETEKFYQGLAMFGTDFSMIAILFPKRNRDQVKNKFNKEERTNPDGVNKALTRKGTNAATATAMVQEMDEFKTFFNTVLANSRQANTEYNAFTNTGLNA